LLAAGGALTEPEPGSFASTALGDCLASEHPVSMRSLFRMLGGPLLGVALEVDDTVRTGEPADEKVLGMGLFEYLAEHPADGAIFDSAMTGVLFDQPHVVEGARTALGEAGLLERCEVVAGDFFESVPAGADAYSFKWIIHDWPEEQGLQILRNTRSAIAPDGKLLLLECVLPEGDEPHFGKVLDVFLMPLGGVERTEAEYADLLARAGFRLTRVVPTLSPMSVIEAVPV
ncbi:MAG: methyltransferase, partial [Acidimicrobiia bacterium]